MRILGMLLTGIGLIWCLIAFTMPTTALIGGEYIGYGELVTNLPRIEAQNLELSDKRRTHLLLSAVLTVFGGILFKFGSISTS